MKKSEKEKLARQIREKIETVKQDIISYTERTKPVVPEAALREAQHTLTKLERALKMIDRPGFGLCRECEEPIPIARLMVMPESDMCVECAEEMT